MKMIVCLLFAVGLASVQTVQADTISDAHPIRSLGFSQSAVYYRSLSASEIVLRLARDHSTAWVFSGNGVMRNSNDDDLPFDVSVEELMGAGFFLGQRRHFGQSSNTRLFGQLLLGGIGESRKRTYTAFASPAPFAISEDSTYRRSVALGLGARASFGGEYLFHPRAGIELSTSIQYSRLIWNLADSIRIRRTNYSTSSQVGINWYW